MAMKRYKATVSYDGTEYVGWQAQKNGVSVQETIEQVMNRITCQENHIVAAGRTDAGVHALGQVFHFDSDFKLDLYGWKKALNGHLPRDIRIKKIEEVSPLFNARIRVTQKQYDYRFHVGEFDVFSARFAYQCPYALDIEKMKKAGQVFVGIHDFSAFCANSFEQKPNQVREVKEIRWNQVGDDVTVSFFGKGFLRYMIRMMMGTLFEVGRGRLSIADVEAILASRDKEACRWNAKPNGLCLMRIEYGEIEETIEAQTSTSTTKIQNKIQDSMQENKEE